MIRNNACLLRLLLITAVGAMANGASPRGNSSIYVYKNGSYTRTVIGAGKPYLYVFSPDSSRNFNSGARYYLQNMSQFKSTADFGYGYSSLGSYYRSAYGYRILMSPDVYSPSVSGNKLLYYPPMFQYYHFLESRYWNNQKPRYVCRNDNAFWPLENQTSEFIFNRRPALNLTAFDVALPTPLNYGFQPSIKNMYLTESEMNGLSELDSLAINKNGPQPYFSRKLNLFVASHTRPEDIPKTTQSPASIWRKRKILTYNYFVCPDGKDPDEIYCCGVYHTQHCCLEETYNALYGVVPAYTYSPFGNDNSNVLDSIPYKIIIGIVILLVGGILGVYRVIRRHRLALANRNLLVPAPPATTTMVYVPTTAGGSATCAPGQPPSGVATAYTAYQPVPGAPPNYASVQYPPPSPRLVPSYPTPGATGAIASQPSGSPMVHLANPAATAAQPSASLAGSNSALNRPATPKMTDSTTLTGPAYSWTPTSYTSTDPISSMSTGLTGYSSTGPYTSAGLTDYTPTSLTVPTSTGPASYSPTDPIPSSSVGSSAYTSTGPTDYTSTDATTNMSNDPTSTLTDQSASTLTYPSDSALGTDFTPYTSFTGSSPYTSLTGTAPFSSSTAAASSLTGTTNFSSLTGSTPYTSLTGSSPYTSMMGSSAYTSSLTGSTPYTSLTGSSPYTSSMGTGFSSLTGTTFNPSSSGGYSFTDTTPKSDEPTS